MASRKEQKEQRKRERLEAEQASKGKQKRQRIYGIAVGGGLVAAVIVVVVVLASGSGSDGGSGGGAGGYGPQAEFADAASPPARSEEDLNAAAKKARCEVKSPAIEGRSHVPVETELEVGENPSTSGDHDAIPQPDGVYSEYPQPRHSMHSMEGGRVLIQYNPDKVTKQEIAQLGGIYNADNLYLLLFPNPEMSYAVAVTSWGHLLGCDKVSDATYDAVSAFIERYRDQAPEQASQHGPAVNGQGWPDGGAPIPEPHQEGAVAGS